MTIEPQERAWHAVEACKWYRINAYNTVNDHSITKGHGMQWRPIVKSLTALGLLSVSKTVLL